MIPGAEKQLLVLTFSFSNPWFLGGLLSAAVLIAVHLFARVRYRKVRFAAVSFISASLGGQRKKFRLYQLLLLVLRCLVLVFISAAFAGPVLFGGSVGGKVGALNVIAIDDSVSTTRRLSNDETVLGRIKKDAIERIRDANAGGFCVYSFGAGVLEWDVSADAAIEAVEGLSANAAMRPLSELGERLAGVGRAGFRGLHVFSDFSPVVMEALRDEAGDFEFDSLSVVGAGFDVPIDNAAIVDAGIKPLGGDGFECSVVVQNRGETFQERDVRLSVMGREIGAERVVLKPMEQGIVRFSVFRKSDVALSSGSAGLRISLSGDDQLSVDDEYFVGVNFGSGDFCNVLIVGREPENFISVEAALLSLKNSGRADNLDYEKILAEDFSGDSLGGVDIVIFDGLFWELAKSGDAINEFLYSGGRAYFFADMERKDDVYGGGKLSDIMAARFGQVVSAESFIGAGDVDVGVLSSIGNYDFSVPCFRNVRRLKLTGGARAVWCFEDGEIFIAEKSVGAGKSFAVNTSLDGSMSDFSVDAAWPMFCKWLFDIGGSLRAEKFSVDEEIVLQVGEELEDLEIVFPDKRVMKVGVAGGEVVVENAGGLGWLYVRDTGRWVGVNVEPRETVLNGNEQGEAAEAVYGIFAGREGFSEAKAERASLDVRHLWKYFMMAAIVVLMMDCFVSGIVGRL